MKKTLRDLRRQTLNRINKGRRVLRILDSVQFEELWPNLTLEESREVEGLVMLNQDEKLEVWANRRRKPDLEEMTLRELRDLAKIHAIAYYGTLNKSSLILELDDAIARAGLFRNASIPG